MKSHISALLATLVLLLAWNGIKELLEKPALASSAAAEDGVQHGIDGCSALEAENERLRSEIEVLENDKDEIENDLQDMKMRTRLQIDELRSDLEFRRMSHGTRFDLESDLDDIDLQLEF